MCVIDCLTRSSPLHTLTPAGTVIAVFGLMNAHGEMLVKDICFPGIAPQPALRVTAEGSPFVMLVSGLDIGPSTDMLPFQLLQEFVGGLLGSPEVRVVCGAGLPPWVASMTCFALRCGVVGLWLCRNNVPYRVSAV